MTPGNGERAKFLVIQPKMIGDVLTSTVICEGLKRMFPGCQVCFVAVESATPVLENNAYIDQVLAISKQEERDPKSFLRFLLGLRKEHYTAVIDAYGKIPSVLISLFSRARVRIAYRKWYTAWVYDYNLAPIVDGRTDMATAIRARLKLLEPLAGERGVPRLYPRISLRTEETEAAREALRQNGVDPEKPLLMVTALGSSDSKSYPLPYLAQVLDRVALRCPDIQLILNYLPGQRPQIDRLFTLCQESTRLRMFPEFYAESLRAYIATAANCRGVLGNEGGGINIAKALSIPTFCLYSPAITKRAWHSEERPEQWGFHVGDFVPQAISSRSHAQRKRDLHELYDLFKPEFFELELDEFCLRYLCSETGNR